MLSIRKLMAGAGASVLAIAAGAGLATAADLPTYTPPPAPAPAQAYTPAPAWSWTGPSAGLVGGYGWGGAGNGWEGGGYLGYNLQTNSHLVLGVEGDLMAAGRSGTNGGGFDVHNNWDATLRARVGYAWDRFMVYGTGGAAFGGLHSNTFGGGTSTTKTGWTAGVGLEAAVTSNVTTRVEYRHTDLGSFAGSNYSSNDLLVGVGFKF